MTTRAPLDSFESALLSELRDVVTERSATRSQPRRRRPVLVAAAAATAVAASLSAVVFGFGVGGTATASAYSVKTQSDGDVVVTIHRLEDAEGLERALRQHGLNVDVNYNPDLFEEDGNGVVTQSDPNGQRGGGTDFEKGGKSESFEGPVPADEGVTGQVRPDTAEPGEPDPCGFTDESPIIAEKVSDDYRFTIPAESILQDRPFEITTTRSSGDSVALMAGFDASDDMFCFLAQL